MIAASRSLTAAAGSALLGAGLIATATIAPMDVATPRLSNVAVELQASVLDIFTFPAWQQAIANEVEFVAIRAAGLAEAGTGLVQSLVALPQTLITAVQQTLSGDPLGALTTLEEASIDAAEAIFLPYVAAQIDVGQIQLAIQSALLPAQPIAAVELGAGLFAAFDTVARAIITAGQNFIDALVSFNIGAIVTSVVDGVTGVVTSIGTGGQEAVDGIVAAQNTIADALAARPVTILEAAAAPAAPAAAAAQSAPAPVKPVDEPAAAAVSDIAATVDLDDAPAAVEAPSAATTPAPRRTSVRTAQRDVAETGAADTAAPKKPAAKRAARAAASN